MAGNGFKDFPKVLLNLPKLESLDISDNPLTCIPKELLNQPNLTTLFLSGDQHHLLPDHSLMSKNLIVKTSKHRLNDYQLSLEEVTEDFNSYNNEITEKSAETLENSLPNSPNSLLEDEFFERKKEEWETTKFAHDLSIFGTFQEDFPGLFNQPL